MFKRQNLKVSRWAWVGMNSKLLFVIAGLIVVSYSGNAFAEPGDLLFTIENPGLKKDMFSSSLGILNDLIIVP